MLNTLDTVIAFAVIMTVLSLLITILVQMVSAALSLRGKNLANALALTFQTIDPKIGEHANSLAAQILRDPIFSDSILRPKSRKQVPLILPGSQAQTLINAERNLKKAGEELRADPANADKKAAFTVAEKQVSEAKSIFTNAETKLATAKQDLAANPKDQALRKAVEDAAGEVKQARAALQMHNVEPNRTTPWSAFSLFNLGDATALGSAIRPGEIYRLLHEFADLTDTEAGMREIPPDVVKASADLLACLKGLDQPAKEAITKLRAIQGVAEIFSEQQQKAVLDSLANFGITVERATTEAYDRFQRWFGSAQDRAEQWFQTHVRVVTIVSSICAAFILQLDTAEIYRKLRDQPQLVEALVKAAPTVVEQGAAATDPAKTPGYETYLLWLEKYPLFPLETLPSDGSFENYQQAIEARLKQAEQKGEIKPDEVASSLAEYDVLKKQGTKQFLNTKKGNVDRLKGTLDEAGFDLVPRGFFRWKDDSTPTWAKTVHLPGPVAIFLAHLFGILATAALLSLGAPFWFNLLKNLTSLRPALANLIEKRPTSAPALPATPASPPSPS